jgi:hypothetical protein
MQVIVIQFIFFADTFGADITEFPIDDAAETVHPTDVTNVTTTNNEATANQKV